MMVTITKVVSKNFLVDTLASLQNIVGHNLTGYEKMVARGISLIEEELKEKKIRLKWYRYETTELTNGAIMIMLYGDTK